MIRRLGLFFAGCLAVWAAVFIPAWVLWPDLREVNLICTLTAGALCILPTALTMAWSLWGLRQNPQQQLLAVLGGTGVRMFFVLGFGLLLAYNVQVFLDHPKTFWFWVLIFYLVTLTLEVVIIVLGQQKQLTSTAPGRQPEANKTAQTWVDGENRIMAHDPVDHVIDETEGFYTIFTEILGGLYIPLPSVELFGYKFVVTKFMILELVAAGLILAIFLPLARRVAGGAAPRGAWWNAFEGLLTFIRDKVAKPTLNPPAHSPHDHDHHHEGDAEHTTAKQEPVGEFAAGAHIPDDADRYVPFLWTIFLFILFCNLLGMIPFGGSPTASLYVTGVLALCSFIMFHAGAIFKMGFGTYMKSYWPSAEIPFGMGLFLKPMIFTIEILGTVIKGGVLAVRLFANMFAGHLVLANLLFFIVATANMGPLLWGGVTVASVLGVFALSLLELFVAFLQAFIFTFLTALFMGMAMNPQH